MRIAGGARPPLELSPTAHAARRSEGAQGPPRSTTRHSLSGRPSRSLHFGEKLGGSHLEDVKADVAVLVDVGVEAGRHEGHLGRLVRVARREFQRELVSVPLIHLRCRRPSRGLRGRRARRAGARERAGQWRTALSATSARRRTVPSPPLIVPVHWKMLSPSGNAEMPASPPIMSDMSSDWRLRAGGRSVQSAAWRTDLSANAKRARPVPTRPVDSPLALGEGGWTRRQRTAWARGAPLVH